MTNPRQDRDPVQLTHAQQDAAAQSGRLAFDGVEFAARIGHRVHQLEHAQIPRRFAVPEVQHGEDAVDLSAEQRDDVDVHSQQDGEET